MYTHKLEQTKLFNQLRRNMELMEESNAKMGRRAIEMEEGDGGAQTGDSAYTATRPSNPSDPTLGGLH